VRVLDSKIEPYALQDAPVVAAAEHSLEWLSHGRQQLAA